MSRFKSGDFNVLIATSVAEEGLDIGEVDLIICLEANKSPIKFVQRLGRTGRKRSGKCITLLTEGKEQIVNILYNIMFINTFMYLSIKLCYQFALCMEKHIKSN